MEMRVQVESLGGVERVKLICKQQQQQTDDIFHDFSIIHSTFSFIITKFCFTAAFSIIRVNLYNHVVYAHEDIGSKYLQLC